MLLGFRQHEIIPPMTQNLCLSDPKTINRLTYTLHTSFVKHDIYQKFYYIHVQARYPLPTNPSKSFEKLDELITRLMHTEDKNVEGK